MADTELTCAIAGCERSAHRQVCPYDGCYHHHGRIHYDCDLARATGHGLTFRKGEWRLVCDHHYDMMLDAIERYDAAGQLSESHPWHGERRAKAGA